jgi:hypothetical protein
MANPSLVHNQPGATKPKKPAEKKAADSAKSVKAKGGSNG